MKSISVRVWVAFKHTIAEILSPVKIITIQGEQGVATLLTNSHFGQSHTHCNSLKYCKLSKKYSTNQSSQTQETYTLHTSSYFPKMFSNRSNNNTSNTRRGAFRVSLTLCFNANLEYTIEILTAFFLVLSHLCWWMASHLVFLFLGSYKRIPSSRRWKARTKCPPRKDCLLYTSPSPRD